MAEKICVVVKGLLTRQPAAAKVVVVIVQGFAPCWLCRAVEKVLQGCDLIVLIVAFVTEAQVPLEMMPIQELAFESE